jgi:predicted  nucleic acid-binding Zn-ribbon protein
LNCFAPRFSWPENVQENKEKIARLRQEFDDLSGLVVRLQFEIQSLREEERHEREKLMLRLENALLKFERQLPPAKEPKKLK